MRQKTHRPRIAFRHQLLGLFSLLLLLSTGFSVLQPNHQATALTSSYINFQARLMNASGAIAPDGNYNVEFKIYNALTSSGSSQGSCTGDAACLWTETRVSTDQVHVANGYLTVNLGSVTALPAINWDQRLYLTMNIGGTGSPTWDGEMAPRLQLTAVPYAFRAGALGAVSGANSTVLDTGTPSGTNLLHLPAESGTLCVQAATTCGFATGTSGSYIQNAPAGQQTANYNIVAGAAGTTAALIQGAASGTAPVAIIRGGNTPGGGQDLLDLQTWNGTTATNVLSVSNTGALTASALATLQGGLTVSGGAAQLNVSSNNNTSINTGSSTGTVSIGNGAAGALSLQSGSTLGVTTTNFNLSTAGVVTLAGAQTADITTANAATATALTISPGTSSTATGAALKLQGGTGGTGAAVLGGAVTVQGGTAAGTGASNGGGVTLQGGTASGSGTKGLIQLNGATYFTTGSYSSGSTSTITQSLVDSNSAILATATAGSLTFTVPAPTITTASGRVLYITNTGSNVFVLNFASSSLTLSVGSTATLIWSGSAWTGAGVDTSTLQNGYSNSAGVNTPEILLDATRNGLDIQDSNAGLGSTVPLLAVRGSASATTLGAPLLTVLNNAGAPLVGIGTQTQTRTLDVAVNSNNIIAPMVLLEQANVAGTSAIEYKNTATAYSFYAGQSASGNFGITSSSAAGQSASSITHVQSTSSAPVGGAGSIALAYGSNTTAGNMLLAVVAWDTTNGTSVTCSDNSGSNVWNVALIKLDPVNTDALAICYAANVAGGPDTVTATFGGTANSRMIAVHEYSGVAKVNPLDVTANNNNAGSSATDGVTSTAATTTQASELIFGSTYNTSGSAVTITQGTGFTHRLTMGTFIEDEDRILTTPGSIATTHTYSAVRRYISIMAAFKPQTTVNDAFAGSLFSLSLTGQAQFYNSTNSSTAFQIKNAATNTLFGVDTTGSTLNVGSVGSATLATTVNVGTSTGSTQTINVGSSSSGSAANGTVVLIQGGNTSTGNGAVGVQTLAGGLLNIGSNNAANTIQIGSITLSSGTQTIQIGNNNTSGGTTNVTIGNGSSATAGTTALQAKTAITLATNGIGRAVFDTSNNLFLGNANTSGQAAAPNDFTVSATNSNAATIPGAALTMQGGAGNTTGAGGLATIQGGASGAGAAAAGGGVTIQGGSATGTGASNGGEVKLQGGSSTNGVKGLIQLNGGTYFTTASYSSGSTSTITQSFIDSNSAILATATAASLTFTVPSPTVTTAGRVLYVTNVGGTNAFTLSFGANLLSLNTGATATLVWSGSAWTGAGADSATLQNDYANSAGVNTPEILLDATRNGLDIQDSNAGLGSTVPLLAVRASASATTLGAALFTVENSSGAPLVGIGTQSQTRTLDIEVNNATTTGLPLLISQSGTGDAGLEVKNASRSYFVGVDSSDFSKFKISSSQASSSTIEVGYPGDIGNTTDSGNNSLISATQVTTSGSAGAVNSVSVYFASNATQNVKMGLFADDGSNHPTGSPVGTTNEYTAVPNAWNTLPMSATVTASTKYWIGFRVQSPATDYGQTNGSGFTCYMTLNYNNAWAPWVSNGTCPAASRYSVVLNYSTSGAYDSFGSALMTLSDTGQTLFKNSVNSSSAFQVQNAGGTNLVNVDSTSAILGLGVVGSTVLASTVNVATSTGATQTINIGSATSGSAANGTVVLMQGGNTSTGSGAVSVQTLAGGLLNIGSNNAANTIQIGSTTLSSGTQTIQIGNNNTSGGTTNITIGTGATATAGTTTLQARTSAVVATNGVTRALFDNTNTMYLGNANASGQAAAPNDFVVQGTGSSTATVPGGKLTVIGGTGNTTGAGGAVTVQGGASAGAGAGGAVTIQGGTANATAGSNGGAVTINSGNGTATGTGGVGANIVLRAGSAGGSGNNAGGNITAVLGSATGTGAQGTFQVQNALGASLLTIDPSNTASSLNLISNGGAETGSPPTGWAAQGAGSSVATGSGTDAASGVQSAKVTFGTTASSGTKVNFTTAPTASTTVNYIVSFSAKLVSGTAMSNTLQVLYSPDNGTTTPQCTNYSTQGLSTTAWTKITCTFVPGSTTVTTALLIIRQSDAPGVSRVIDIDNLSVVQQNSAGTTNVGDLKVGGALSQGLTLLTLDTYAATPFSGSNSSLAGSMYFDTSQGKIQCYDGTNWGACGAAPNSIVTLSPEFAGAVLHGTVGTAGGTDNNIGTLTSDFCSDFLDINDATHGTSICGTNETFNFYRWTSPQSNAQTYDVYITYQLPSTFKNFVSGQTNMLGRTDSANSTVTYSVYKNVSGTGLSLCSAAKTISTGVQSSWQTATPTTDLSTCSFAANNSVVVKVEVTSSSNANAYIGTLNFQYSNQ